jgi:hypothetical protein
MGKDGDYLKASPEDDGAEEDELANLFKEEIEKEGNDADGKEDIHASPLTLISAGVAAAPEGACSSRQQQPAQKLAKGVKRKRRPDRTSLSLSLALCPFLPPSPTSACVGIR